MSTLTFKRWILGFVGDRYVIDLEHHHFSGRLRIFVNHEQVYAANMLMVIGEHTWRVGGHAVVLTIENLGMRRGYQYTLTQDTEVVAEISYCNKDIVLLRPNESVSTESASLLMPMSGSGHETHDTDTLLRPAGRDGDLLRPANGGTMAMDESLLRSSDQD